jgi:hypothetical protein
MSVYTYVPINEERCLLHIPKHVVKHEYNFCVLLVESVWCIDRLIDRAQGTYIGTGV